MLPKLGGELFEERRDFLLKKFINDPYNVVNEMLEGFLAVNGRYVRLLDTARTIVRADMPVGGKVGIITGGGSGHKPAFIGYIGENMVDAVAIGEIFSSPTAKAFYDAFKTADSGKGVACLYGNYAGDNMNVKMAIKMAEKDSIAVKTVIANDDVASAPKEEKNKRRGVAGEVLMWKIAGAKAALGGNLDEVISVAQIKRDST